MSAVLAAGCGDGDSSQGRSGGGGGGGGAKAPAAGKGALVAGEQVGAPKGAPLSEREIVYTADAVVRVDDVEAAAREATKIAEDAEGYLAGQDAELEGDQQSTLTLRVPSAQFRPVLDDLTELGRVQQRKIDSADVTEEVVDLTGRLESARTSADRLRKLLAEAPGTPEVIAIEQELAKRESEIEGLEGRLRVLDDQTSLATIKVRFTEKDEPPKVDEDLPGFFQALKAGGVSLVTVLLVLLAGVGYALPFVPFVVLGWFLFRWFRRRRTNSPPPSSPRTKPSAPSGPEPEPGGPDSRPAPPAPPEPAPVD